MSRVSPCRFEAKSSRKMDSSSPQKGYPFWVPTFYSSLHCCPPHPHPSSLPIERGDLGIVAPLMRSCFAWLVITEWFNPLLVEDMFCFWTQMGFSHWHEPVFDCVGEGVWAGHSAGSALSLLISVSVLWCTITPLNLLARSICEIRKEGAEMKGEWGRIVISLYASINAL